MARSRRQPRAAEAGPSEGEYPPLMLPRAAGGVRGEKCAIPHLLYIAPTASPQYFHCFPYSPGDLCADPARRGGVDTPFAHRSDYFFIGSAYQLLQQRYAELTELGENVKF